MFKLNINVPCVLPIVISFIVMIALLGDFLTGSLTDLAYSSQFLELSSHVLLLNLLINLILLNFLLS